MAGKPNIRFRGFTDDWEQRKLGDISKTTIGEFVIKTKQDDSYPYPVFNGGSSNTGFYNEFNNEGNKILVSARGANAGFVNLIKTRYWAGNSCYSIDLLDKTEFDTDFIYQEMKRNQSRFTDNQQAANIPSVSKSDVEKFVIEVPQYAEQVKIANYFTNLDNLITLHQRKCDQTKELKKFMLQKMFPKQGEKKPEIRFSGFTGDWEQRKLGEVLSFQNGFNGGRKAFGEGVPLISVMDILNNQFISYDVIRGKATVTDDEYEKYAVRYGDVLFQRSSENVEDAGSTNVYIDTDKNAIFGGFVIRGKQIYPYRPKFMKYLLDTKTVRNQITKKAQGAQHVNVSQETLQDVSITLPSKAEQLKIETCLYNLDNLITLHQNKCDEYKEHKNYMLQNMFPQN